MPKIFGKAFVLEYLVKCWVELLVSLNRKGCKVVYVPQSSVIKQICWNWLRCFFLFVVVIGHRDGIISHVENSFFVAFPNVELWHLTFDFDFSEELFHMFLYV